MTSDVGGKRASKATRVVINDKILCVHSIAFSFSYSLSLSTYLSYSNVSDAVVTRINQFPTTTSAVPNAFIPVSEICSSYDETCPSDVFPMALPILLMGIPLRPGSDRCLHIFRGTTASFRRWISPFRHSTMEVRQTLELILLTCSTSPDVRVVCDELSCQVVGANASPLLSLPKLSILTLVRDESSILTAYYFNRLCSDVSSRAPQWVRIMWWSMETQTFSVWKASHCVAVALSWRALASKSWWKTL